MAKKQSRRTISVRAVTYATVRDDCARRALSMSDYVEGLIAADHKARGVPAVMPVADAARAVKREASVEVAKVARALPAMPLHATDHAPHLNALKARRWLQDGAARAALARRDAPRAPVAIRSGFEPKASVEQARPASGDKVPPPDPSRSARNVVIF